jgi:hypothetical protein
LQQSKICATVCCIITLFATAADYGFGKLPIAKTYRLPVQTFPTKIGQWQSGPLIPVAADVQAMLPSAIIWERTYTDTVGRTVDLTLVTSKDNINIHDPNVCLPAQGWQIINREKYTDNGQQITMLDLTQDDQKMRCVFWLSGYYPPKLSNHFWIQDAALLRSHIVKTRESASLLVRIISDTSNGNIDAPNIFAKAALPYVNQLTETAEAPKSGIQAAKSSY